MRAREYAKRRTRAKGGKEEGDGTDFEGRGRGPPVDVVDVARRHAVRESERANG